MKTPPKDPRGEIAGGCARSLAIEGRDGAVDSGEHLNHVLPTSASTKRNNVMQTRIPTELYSGAVTGGGTWNEKRLAHIVRILILELDASYHGLRKLPHNHSASEATVRAKALLDEIGI